MCLNIISLIFLSPLQSTIVTSIPTLRDVSLYFTVVKSDIIQCVIHGVPIKLFYTGGINEKIYIYKNYSHLYFKSKFYYHYFISNAYCRFIV